jgi:PEP-CTERM motif
MRTLKATTVIAVALIALALTVPRAFADQQLVIGPNSDCSGSATGTCGLTITITAGQLDATHYYLDYLVQNTGVAGTYYLDSTTGGFLQSFAVTAFTHDAVTNATVTLTDPLLAVGTYSLTANSSGNNGNGDNCTGGPDGALCLQMVMDSAVSLVDATPYQEFKFLITDPTGSLIVAPGTWNVKTLVTQDDNTSGSPGPHYVALSTSGAPSPYVPVPEPASIILFGTGALGLGALCRPRRV